MAVLPVSDPWVGERTVIRLLGKSKDVLSKLQHVSQILGGRERNNTNITANPRTFRSKISSSYLSASSGLGGAASAKTALYSPEPDWAGSPDKGCISDTTRVAPTGRADVGVVVSTLNIPWNQKKSSIPSKWSSPSPIRLQILNSPKLITELLGASVISSLYSPPMRYLTNVCVAESGGIATGEVIRSPYMYECIWYLRILAR